MKTVQGVINSIQKYNVKLYNKKNGKWERYPYHNNFIFHKGVMSKDSDDNKPGAKITKIWESIGVKKPWTYFDLMKWKKEDLNEIQVTNSLGYKTTRKNKKFYWKVTDKGREKIKAALNKRKGTRKKK
mgnify:CR=1 FL=1|tara:strand:- start:101 stop:484 length:384 start_codon:yes stop_codon:yes gene_type:complete